MGEERREEGRRAREEGMNKCGRKGLGREGGMEEGREGGMEVFVVYFLITFLLCSSVPGKAVLQL